MPSAFLTTSAGNLYGENGPIASAELTSLTPETVKYTIAPNEKWSNGTALQRRRPRGLVAARASPAHGRQ